MEPKLMVASLLASLTLADAIVIAVMIFVAFLSGLWCGAVWQRRRMWSRTAGALKRRAQRG